MEKTPLRKVLTFIKGLRQPQATSQKGAKGISTLNSLSPLFPVSLKAFPVAKPKWKSEESEPVAIVNQVSFLGRE